MSLNVSSISAQSVSRSLLDTQQRLERNQARLSSGLRINSARDDAAGLAIASRMDAQSRQLTVNMRNLNDQISLLQVADAALANISDNLQRIRTLAVQASNDSNNRQDRQALQIEASQLMSASRQIQKQTQFNGHSILDGHFQFESGTYNNGQTPLSIAALFLPKTTDVTVRYAQMYQASTTVTPGGALSTGDLIINGRAIGATQAGSANGQSASSAWAIAAAINASAGTGFSATANGTSISGSYVVQPNNGNISQGSITINGVAIGAGNIVSAINAQAGLTGVLAQLVSGQATGVPPQTPYALVLSASDGRDIDVSGAGAFGLGDTHAVGSITLISTPAEGAQGNLNIAGAGAGNAGLSSGILLGSLSGEPIAVPLTEEDGYDINPNLSDHDSAQATITQMDNKLNKLLNLRVRLGGILNTLNIENEFLAGSRESALASRSRILDTDFAQETAQSSKERMLLDAGTALVTQANIESRRVLMLLVRGGTN